jgi:hypothetical protein
VASRHSRQRQGLLTALIAMTALIGLLAGALTRALITNASASTSQSQNPEPTATATQQPQPIATATESPTIAPVLVHFTIKLTVSPASAHPGDAISITALATDSATGAPIPGLTCVLRAPTNGVSGLFTTWPTPTATNESGIASWTANAPANTPGRYEIEAFAQTPSWSYVARTTVIITAL